MSTILINNTFNKVFFTFVSIPSVFKPYRIDISFKIFVALANQNDIMTFFMVEITVDYKCAGCYSEPAYRSKHHCLNSLTNVIRLFHNQKTQAEHIYSMLAAGLSVEAVSIPLWLNQNTALTLTAF